MIRRSRQNGARRAHAVAVLGAVALLAAAAVAGIGIAFRALQDIWREQCRVTDRELDVVISSGKMVHPDIITLFFGLTNGANLATIPFAELREKLLARVPNIRELKIERRLPNRVTIDVIEREPAVRIAPPKGRADTGRVADLDGVVFPFSSEVESLPVVREAGTTPTPPGRYLSGMAAAAVRLVRAAASPDLSDLSVLEVETSHPDYLLVTFGDYSRAKIAWDHMQDDSRHANDSLHRQLKRLSQAMATRLIPQPALWNATDYGKPMRIYVMDPARSPGH